MKFYEIYAGLSGGFGGAQYQCTEQFECIEDAEERAYWLARDEYESKAGLHGLESYEDALNEAKEQEGDNCSEVELRELADEIYNEYIESWIEYYAKESEEDDEDDNYYEE